MANKNTKRKNKARNQKRGYPLDTGKLRKESGKKPYNPTQNRK